MRYLNLGVLLLLIAVVACGSRNARPDGEKTDSVSQTVVADGLTAGRHQNNTGVHPLSPSALKLDSLGYVNVADLDPSIAVHIVYATPDNFVGEVMYDDLVEAYLLPDAAKRVVEAQRLLQENHPEYRLIVYDAARPMSVQRRMWKVAVENGKQYYVADPAKGGGLHNYGAAVDLSILDGKGKPLPMGTEFDFLGPEANTDNEKELVRAGKLTEQELANRLLLRRVMTSVGFRTVTSEWWHFNLCSREEARQKYPLIEL